MRLSKWVLNLLLFTFASISAQAQNTGGVFPPTVNEGHKSVQWRAAINPDGGDQDFRYASRLHYQEAVNDDVMWRIVGQVNNASGEDFKFDFVQAELFWELSDKDAKTKTGLRFDARYRGEDRPAQVGVNAMSQFDLGQDWSARAVGLTSLQFGDNAKNGVNLQTRWQVAKRVKAGTSIGLQLYNNYGNTNGIRDFKDQSHTIGPFISTPIAKDISLFAGPLVGLTNGSPDFEARFWLTQRIR